MKIENGMLKEKPRLENKMSPKVWLVVGGYYSWATFFFFSKRFPFPTRDF